MYRRVGRDVFTYLDYRAFLRDFYVERKTQTRNFSYRAFSSKAQLGSPNYLKLVMDGRRNLSTEMAERFATACGMRGEAARYFCSLVSFNQSKSSEDRSRHYAKLLAFRRYREAHRLDVAHAEYHSRWYLPAVRELAGLEGFQDDPGWIANTLVPAITPGEAKEALEILEELGLLVRDGEGALRRRDAVVSTGPEMRRLHIARYHRTMLQRAADSIDLFPSEERDISAVTLLLRKSALGRLKARLQELRRELLETSEEEDDPDIVVQVNLQMFPLSRPPVEVLAKETEECA